MTTTPVPPYPLGHRKSGRQFWLWRPVPNKPYGFCGRKATSNQWLCRAFRTFSNKVKLCLTSTETTRLIRDGEKVGKGVMEVGGGEIEIIYPSLHCHQHDFCIKTGNDESHFNVSVGSDGQSHRTVSTNRNLFEEKGEPKPRYRTEVLPLTSLPPSGRWATPPHRTFSTARVLHTVHVYNWLTPAARWRSVASLLAGTASCRCIPPAPAPTPAPPSVPRLPAAGQRVQPQRILLCAVWRSRVVVASGQWGAEDIRSGDGLEKRSRP